MKVELVVRYETATHNYPEGAKLELPDDVAESLIDAGIAKKVGGRKRAKKTLADGDDSADND
jgi:hypothetical protein